MARRHKHRNRDENPFDEDFEDRRPKRTRQSRERRRRWPLVLILFLVVLGLLPNILSWTGLHQRAVNYALKDFNGKVSVERMGLGWFQPVSFSGIKAIDADGNELLTVDRVATSQSLLGLVNGYFRTNDFGDITISGPTARVDLRPEGSNLEDALVKYLKADSASAKEKSSSSAPMVLPKLNLMVNDGRALVTSSTENLFWQIEGLNLSVASQPHQDQTSPASPPSPLTLDTNCLVTELTAGPDGKPQPIRSGKLQLQTKLDPGAPSLLLKSAQVALEAEKLPISLAAPAVQRFIGPARSTGLLTTKIDSQVDLEQLALGINVQSFDLQELQLVAPQWMGKDQLQVRNVHATGRMQLSPQMISSTNFEVQTDVGKVKSHGSFDVNQLTQFAAEGKLLNEPLDLQGELDLATLVRMLPETFKLHEDLQVDSGLITFQANTKTEGDARRLIFQADAANLKGKRGSQMLVWQHPLKLGGAIRQAGTRLALESLDLQTDFLRVVGNATLESGSFAVKGDLNRLVERVGQFVDLTGIDLAGMIEGNLGWQAAEGVSLTSNTPIPIQLGGQFELAQPKIKLPELPSWQPQQLLVKFSGAGLAQMDQATSATQLEVQSGGVRVDIGSENATAILAAPIRYPFDTKLPVSVNCEAHGNLNGWLAHLRNIADLGTMQAAGEMMVKGNVALHDNLLVFKNIQYQARELAFDGYGMKIRDPDVNGMVEGSFELGGGEFRLADATLISSAVAARGQNLRLAFVDKLQADGGIGFRADVNRLSQWFELAPHQDSVHWFGAAEGMLQFASQPQGVASQLSVKLVDLIAAQQQAMANAQPDQPQVQWVELYRDPMVQIESQVEVAGDFNSLVLQNSSIKSSAGSLEASGTVADLSNTLLLDLQGRSNPNWDKIQALLAAYTYRTVGLTGSGTKPFSIRGPLLSGTAQQTAAAGPTPWVPAQLEASLSIGWDQGSFLEVPIGASEINLDLKNSVGYVGTRGIPFSGGSIQLAPYIDLRGPNPLVVMKPTRVIDNVALSQDTARQWLKYVAPLVADATSAQGSLTLDMESLQMPVLNPLSMEANGTIQMSDVVIGAGPLADQLLAAVQQVRSLLKPQAGEKDLKTWLQLSQQTIPFMIKDQMVHHENVTIAIKDITIITSGSVGFDQSLRMLAEIPIADDWIAGKPYLAGLRGQRLRIPIGGTVSKPQLDKRAVQGLSAELARSAASGAVNQAITEKLLPKANELQGQLNQKVSTELDKLQQRVGEKVGGGLGQLPLGGFKLGNGLLPGTNRIVSPNDAAAETNGAATEGTPSGGTEGPMSTLENQLEGELKKGLNELFKRK